MYVPLCHSELLSFWINYCHSKLWSFRITVIPNIAIPNYFYSELLSFQTSVISNYCHFEYPNETTYCLLVLQPLLVPALASAEGRHICEYSLIYFSLNCTVQPYIRFSITRAKKIYIGSFWTLKYVESRNLMHQENWGKMSFR